jgi:hypothetical protein
MNFIGNKSSLRVMKFCLSVREGRAVAATIGQMIFLVNEACMDQ